ncbi:EAL domain-containing protein [Psychromonas sp. 14N.309.X.WAT.B.A12]|uniref:EAL domain-containing protein n=1 Tax=unclassified Psychromonas TaxID=2614957 RepID=UPI0025AFC8F3|nr:EAL domain-containing protein [Psychromonas sp. 14N.309.X.WAT.B.A12]MDN2663088.1 EAL domain-containing protein [Psychromonas sp. 14N.309.X.WAT.B.A12]
MIFPRTLTGSLNAKLLMILMMVALFSSMTIAAMFTVYELNSVTKAEESKLNSIAKILAPNLTATLIFQDETSAAEQLESLLGQSNIVSAAIIDKDGEQFVGVSTEKNNQITIFNKLMVSSTPLMMKGVEYGLLTISADYSVIERSLLFFSFFLLAILALILLLSFLLSLFLRKILIYPLTHLASVAERVTNTNNYNLRSKVLSSDEVGNLANCFNSMLETIKQRDNSLEETVQQRTSALEVANNKLTTQAFSDPLSGLPNRRYILDKLANLVSCSEQHEFALLGLDLDGFKEINDTMGHDYGDLLLIEVSRCITQILDNGSTLARLGGDEFLILVEGNVSEAGLSSLANTINQELAKGFLIEGKHVFVTTSIGIALFPVDGQSVENLIKYADLAMYKSKEAGRNSHHFFEQNMLNAVIQKHQLVEDLRHSLANEHFELYYQPIVNLLTNKMCKAEALIRWNHPERGLIPPNEFIAIAEEVGLILEMGEWVARTAARDLAQFKKLGAADDFQISINVSPVQFKGDGQWILDWFKYTETLGLPRDAIIIEITENLLMESEDSVRAQLTKLKKRGIAIAIDDFGVGYSSLSYLQKMDVDVLKIDKSFVDELENEKNSRELCQVIIMMAHHLDIQVVAEGIENAAQKQILTNAGCEFGQGYLFAKPLPIETFKRQYFIHSSPIDLSLI